jgi:hypothetical protein
MDDYGWITSGTTTDTTYVYGRYGSTLTIDAGGFNSLSRQT